MQDMGYPYLVLYSHTRWVGLLICSHDHLIRRLAYGGFIRNWLWHDNALCSNAQYHTMLFHHGCAICNMEILLEHLVYHCGSHWSVFHVLLQFLREKTSRIKQILNYVITVFMGFWAASYSDFL